MTRAERIRVILADDHPVVRLGIRNLLMTEPETEVVAETSDGDAAFERTCALRPHILLLDLAMPHTSGMEVLQRLAQCQIATKTIILTGSLDKEELLQAIDLGARGIVLKEAGTEDILRAIVAVHNGNLWFGHGAVASLVQFIQQATGPGEATTTNSFGLTPREREIVLAVVEGCTNKDVAAKLAIAEDTVKRHMTNIFNKLGMSTRVELAMFAVAHGLVRTPANHK